MANSNKSFKIYGRDESTSGGTKEAILPSSVAGFEDIIAVGGEALQVSSDDATDDVGDVGATEVLVCGFDANGDEVEETFAMNGVAAVPGSVLFETVTSFRVTQAGTDGMNAGQIFLTIAGSSLASGIPDTDGVIGVIDYSLGTGSLYALRIPKGYKATIQVGSICDVSTVEFILQVMKKDESAWNTPVIFPANSGLPGGFFNQGDLLRMHYQDGGAGSQIITGFMDVLLQKH